MKTEKRERDRGSNKSIGMPWQYLMISLEHQYHTSITFINTESVKLQKDR